MAKQLLWLLRWYPPLQESWGLEMGLLRGIWFPAWEALRGQEGDLVGNSIFLLFSCLGCVFGDLKQSTGLCDRNLHS